MLQNGKSKGHLKAQKKWSTKIQYYWMNLSLYFTIKRSEKILLLSRSKYIVKTICH